MGLAGSYYEGIFGKSSALAQGARAATSHAASNPGVPQRTAFSDWASRATRRKSARRRHALAASWGRHRSATRALTLAPCSRPGKAGGRRSVSRVLCLCGHLSGTAIAHGLKRLTRRVRGPHHPLLSSLAPDGVWQAGQSPGRRCALTAPFHRYREACAARLCVFCATFRRVTPPGRYPASCPMEPGLSSPAWPERPPDLLPV